MDTNGHDQRPDGEWLIEIEESAEGAEFFETPGDHMMAEKERDQAQASGWIPDQVPALGHTETGNLQQAATRRRLLREAASDLEAALAAPIATNDWLSTLYTSLTVFNSALDSHIATTEGRDGLLADIREKSPRLDVRVEAMEREHNELSDECSRALAMVAGGAGAVEPEDLRRKLTGLLGSVAVHRQRGSDLVYEAFNADISGGD